MTSALPIRIVLSVLVVLTGLVLGLILRRLLLRRLRKTILDEWLIQLLGVVLVIIILIVAMIGSSSIATNGLDWLLGIWAKISSTAGIQARDMTSFGENIFFSIFIIIFAIGVARTLSRFTMRGIGEHRLDLHLRIVINRVSYILVLIVATFWILSLWQVAIVLPVAVLGTLTVAITFSVQDILKDLVAGLYLLVERPFFIGDQISTDTYTGKVEAVELRATRLRLVSGEEVTVPNGLIFGSVVINNTRYSERRATITVTLPLDDFSSEQTPELILRQLRGIETVLAKPEPSVSVTGIVDANVELTVRFWIASGQIAVITDVMLKMRDLLPRANVAVKEAAGDI
jgi:small-conductance mechanosensitive channel